MVFSDFDSVRHDKLIEALTRMSIPPKCIEAIKSLYKGPSFCVKIGDSSSTWRKQRRGIWQGCPLSPYLFVILMTVMFRDIHGDLGSTRGRLEDLGFTELLYADDTALVTKNVHAMNRLLAQIEKHAAYYGLNFNKGKCVSMAFNSE